MTSNISEKNKNSATNIYNIVTLQDVNNIVKKFFNDTMTKVIDYNIQSLTGKTIGFLGSHQELIITVQKKDGSELEILNLFVKSIPYRNKEKLEFIMNQEIFAKESNIFNIIIPLLKKHFKGEKWSPTCYLASKEVLIMENLKFQGYQMRGRLFNNTKLLKSALVSLARLHGCSILAEAHLNCGFKPPLNLNERFPESFKEIMFCGKDMALKWFTTYVNIAACIANNLGHDSQKIRKIFDRVFDIVKPLSNYHNVVTHGDLWTNNLMFDESEPIPKCVLVDFQLVRYAPLVLDILQLLYLNASRDYRKQSEKDLIKFYHSKLEETIKINDTTKNVEILRIEDILKDYEELRVFGIIVALLYHPNILIDSKFHFKSGKDFEFYENFLFEEQLQLTLSCMKKNQFFKSILEDEVNELAEIVMDCKISKL